MVYYKPVKVIINVFKLAKVIFDMVIQHYRLSNFIITNPRLLFTSKFWFSLYYFFGIKQRLSIMFYLQNNQQTKYQNSTMEVYLQTFVNIEQNDQAKFLPMVKFVYNNTKNVNNSYTTFELNYGYHPHILFKKDIHPRSRSMVANKLLLKL